MKKVLTPDQMRAADTAYGQTHGGTYDLMESAGSAVARTALRVAGGAYGTRVLVVCGKGNNAGDGLVAARRIKQAGGHAVVVLIEDPSRLAGDALAAFEKLRGVRVHSLPALDDLLRRSDLVIDAMFGTGFKPPLPTEMVRVAAEIAQSGKPVISIDIPSGVDARTGDADQAAVRADLTVVLAALKPGHLLGKGKVLSGALQVAGIGLPEDSLISETHVPEAHDVARAFPPRPPNAHKRSVGKVLVVAGSSGMSGAAVLAAQGAYRSGTGLVRMAVPENLVSAIDLAVLEALTVGLPATSAGSIASSAVDQVLELSMSVDAVVLGPGIGRDDETSEFVRKIVPRLEKPLVLDADGLSPFTSDPGSLLERHSPTVITPHAGELARLLSADAELLNTDRITAAMSAAKRTGAVVVFKGPGTVVAGPDGRVAIIDRGGPELATAGTGDVLSGIIATLLTRSDPFTSAYAGAWLHGRAGDLLNERTGSQGSVASDLVRVLSEVLEELARA